MHSVSNITEVPGLNPFIECSCKVPSFLRLPSQFTPQRGCSPSGRDESQSRSVAKKRELFALGTSLAKLEGNFVH